MMRIGLLAVSLAVAIPASGFAQTSVLASEGWSLSVGPGLLVKPDYPGADTYDVMPIPGIVLTYDDWFFVDPARGAGVESEVFPGVTLSGGLDYQFGRKEKDSAQLAGMGDIDGGVSTFGGLSLRPFSGMWRALSLDTRVEVPLGGDLDGAEITTDLSATIPNDHGFISLRVGAGFMTSDMMDGFFGVTPAQAAASGLPAYNPDGGLRAWRLGATYWRTLGGRWSAVATGGYDRIVGDAARSPITQSRDQFHGAAAIIYRFGG